MPRKKKTNNLAGFKRTVWKFYQAHGRHDLPWRKTRDPYRILVSEIMLQQTQVDRVIPKYKNFLLKFPTVQDLSRASSREVLIEWQGLGYNKRAVNLKHAAEIVANDLRGKFPGDLSNLLSLPGIGKTTAGDLLAFAWNEPAIVIETNIRTVFIHHFFKDQELVSDTELAVLVEETVDRENPRDWYYALMDYGASLKKSALRHTVPNSRSAHYKKQTPFKGSNRELRSKILKLILKKSRSRAEILKLLDSPAPEINKNLIALEREGLLRKKGAKFTS